MNDKFLIIINQVLQNAGKKPIKQITGNELLRDDFGFDSLQLAELTVRTEEAFGIDIFEDGIKNTVNEVLEILKNNEK